MLKLLALGALLLTMTGKPIEDTSPRIINGMKTPITLMPYQVSLENNGEFCCGGSIINREFVLTAAHCVQGSQDKLKVRAGSTMKENGGSLHNVRNIYQHDGFYRQGSNGYDIALLRISPRFQFNKNITKIPLCIEEIPEKAEVTVSGWGATETWSYNYPLVLKSANIFIVSQTECRIYYSHLPESVFCAGGEGSGVCSGDSGGPVTVNGCQVGIVSYGNNFCGVLPDVYTKVSDYISWIESYTHNPKCRSRGGE